MSTPDTPRNRGNLDAPHLIPTTPAEDARTVLLNRVSWGAVLAGVFLSLVTQLLLNLLGVGVGAATIDPMSGDNPSPTGFSIGAAIWWAVSGILAAYVGGYAAGRLAGEPRESSAAWHGLTAWAVTTLVVFYLLTTAVGSVIGGAYRAVTDAMGGVAAAGGTAAEALAPSLGRQGNPLSALEQSVRSAAGGNDPSALRDAAVSAMRAVVSGDPAQGEAAREQAAAALAKAQNIPVEQARTQVKEYEDQYRKRAEQAKQQAKEAADATAKGVSRGAWLSAIALLLGALAAWFGGRAGAVEPTITSARLRSGV